MVAGGRVADLAHKSNYNGIILTVRFLQTRQFPADRIDCLEGVCAPGSTFLRRRTTTPRLRIEAESDSYLHVVPRDPHLIGRFCLARRWTYYRT